MKAILLLLVGSLLLTGCASTTSYTDRPLAPTSSSREIDVVSKSDIPGKYTIIGQVEGNNVHELKDRARKLGGDAITTPGIGMWATYRSDVIKYK